MTQKQIYEAICDLAYEENTSPEEYILGLIKGQNDSIINGYDGLPDDVKQRLINAEKSKREARDIKKRERNEKEMRQDIEKFREYFPDTAAEDIPESVWNEAAEGIPLSYAYALYLKAKERSDSAAAEANLYADERAIPIGNDESEVPYSKEEVENMSTSAVKNNYRKILDSIKGWKF